MGEEGWVIGGGEDGIWGVFLEVEFKYVRWYISEFSLKELVIIRVEFVV